VYMLVAFLALLAFFGLLRAKCAENVECAKGRKHRITMVRNMV